jgi:hypothetical protein
MMVQLVDMDEFDEVETPADLAEALDQLGEALKKVERVGDWLGFRWWDHMEGPGEEPGNLGAGLQIWAERVRTHDRSFDS